MKKTILLLFILNIFLQPIEAQKKCKSLLSQTINVGFDSAGKIIQFPKAVIRQNNKIQFSLKLNQSYIDSELHAFYTLLTATEEGLQKISSVKFKDTLHLKGKDSVITQSPYDCLFGGGFTKYTDNLKNYISTLENGFCGNEETINTLMAVKDDHIPIKEFVSNTLEKQFEVRVYNHTTLVDSFFLNATCKNGCIIFESNCEIIKSMLCKDCAYGNSGEFQFQLIQYNPLSTTVANWYNKQLKDLSSVFNKHSAIINNADDYIKALRLFVADTDCKGIISDYSAVQTLNEWFNNWLWFTSGSLSLDPLSSINETEQKELKSAITQLQMQIQNLSGLKTFIDSIRVKLPAKEKNIAEFIALSEKIQHLINALQFLQDKKDAMVKRLAAGSAIVEKYKINYAVLYNGKIEISKFGNVQVQKQFDAASDYNPVYQNKRELNRVTEFPEDEKVKIVVHNVDSNKNILLEEKRLDFDDIEEFTKQINEQLSKIDFSSIISPQLTNLKDFLSSFNVGGTENIKGAGEDFKKRDSLFSECLCEAALQMYLKPLLDDYDENKITFPPNNLFTTPGIRVTDKALHYSIVQPVKVNVEAPYRDSINVKQFTGNDTAHGTNAAITYIKIGKLRYSQLAAGIAFTQSPVSTTIIDTTGGSFKVSNSDNRAAAIFGFKIYPFQSYNRDNSLIPRYPLRRFSAFAGFEIVHPLNNFFLGGSYDIVPGLAFSYGGNLYLKTNYTVQNGAITNTARSYKWSGGYYSVTVNPTLFVQFVKLFFK